VIRVTDLDQWGFLSTGADVGSFIRGPWIFNDIISDIDIQVLVDLRSEFIHDLMLLAHMDLEGH
jgi:hypothetical protein